MVGNGVALLDAYEGMIKLATDYACMQMPLTLGCGGLPALRAGLPASVTRYFGQHDLDVKTIYQSYQLARGEKIQSGLAKSMVKLGLNFKGIKHRATDDAKNTFVIFCNLWDRFKK